MKIIQIAVLPETSESFGNIFGLDDEGGIWARKLQDCEEDGINKVSIEWHRVNFVFPKIPKIE